MIRFDHMIVLNLGGAKTSKTNKEPKVHALASATTFSESVWSTNSFRTKEKKRKRSCILLAYAAQKEFDLLIYFEFLGAWKLFCRTFLAESWTWRLFSYHKYSLTNCQWPTWINFWGSGKIKFTTPTFISWSEMPEWEAVCSSFYRILCRFLVFECTLLAISRRIWTRVDHQDNDTLPPSGSKRFFMIVIFVTFLGVFVFSSFYR